MASILESAINYAYSFIPPPETLQRKVIYSYICQYILSGIAPTKNSARDIATALHLNKPGGQNLQNLQGLKKTYYDKNFLQQVAAHPTYSLLQSHMPDLLSRVAAAAALYFTFNFSLQASLLSNSEKISKLAEPIFKAAALLPIPPSLQSVYVIALSPVIAKLFHIALDYFEMDGAATFMNRASQALQFLINLRSMLLCTLSTHAFFTTTLLTLISNKVIIQSVVNLFEFIKWKDTDKILAFLTQLASTFTQLASIFAPSNIFLSFGSTLGLNGMIDSLQASSDPCDEALKELFNQVNNLQEYTLDNLGKFKESIDAIKSDISSALKSDKITPSLASKLFERVDAKMSKTLSTIVLNPQFETGIPSHDKQFEEAFCQGFNEEETKQFMQLLTNLKQTKISQDGFNKQRAAMNKLFSSESTLWLLHACATILWPAIKNSYETTNIPVLKKYLPYLCASELNIMNLQLKEFENIGCSKKAMNALRTEIFKSIQESYPKDLTLMNLRTVTPVLLPQDLIPQLRTKNFFVNNSLSISHEEQLINLFGTDGFLHRFAVTKKEQDSAYLLSAKFHLQRFELNFNWYLENKPSDPQKCKEVEYYLFLLAHQARLDVKKIEQSLDFDTWRNAQPSVDQNQNEHILAYLKRPNLFEFAKSALNIPEIFKFKTVGLPALINENKKLVQTPLILKSHFPAPWCEKTWDESATTPELSEEMSKTSQEMYKYLREKHAMEQPHAILVSQAIQNV